MKLEVEVKRAEQSWDLRTRHQQNYLVVEVFGIEVRAPCSEEQLIAVLSELSDAEAYDPQEDLDAIVDQVPNTFVPSEDELPHVQPSPHPAQLSPAVGNQLPAQSVRRLQPIERPRGDDVGIAQG